jgi:hypothetical protein
MLYRICICIFAYDLNMIHHYMLLSICRYTITYYQTLGGSDGQALETN